MFCKTKIFIGRMDIFTLGNEFIDGKSRLKSVQCGADWFCCMAYRVVCLQNIAFKISNMCQSAEQL